MVDINCPAKSEWLYPYMSNISICGCHYPGILMLIGFTIQSHVEVIGTQFAKVCRQCYLCLYGIDEISFRIIFCRKYLTEKCGRNEQQTKKKEWFMQE